MAKGVNNFAGSGRNDSCKDSNDLNKNNCFQIRRAHKSEAGKILNLVQAAFADYNEGEQNPALQESLIDIQQDIKNEIVLVAVKDEQVTGTLRLIEWDQDTLYLKRFAILPAFQDQGIGTTLVKEAKKIALKSKVKFIYLHSTVEDERLVKFYKKLGFKCQEIDTDNGYRRGLWVLTFN